jgi:hypothetical protein
MTEPLSEHDLKSKEYCTELNVHHDFKVMINNYIKQTERHKKHLICHKIFTCPDVQ